MTTMPVVFLPHGGGPWPFVEMGFGSKPELESLSRYLKSIPLVAKSPIKAVLAISAHWEEAVTTVMSSARPPLLFDYSGFPPESYQLTWPTPGSPLLAVQVQDLLRAARIQSAADDRRGYDHGTFVPLKLAFPEADIPTVQLSLKQGLDPAEHLAIGRALAPLRDEGVLIIGSGMTFHNMRGFGDSSLRPAAEAFDGWLRETCALDSAGRDDRLKNWSKAPSARLSHPREEHLLPLMVVAGAAGKDLGVTAFRGTLTGLPLSAYHFG